MLMARTGSLIMTLACSVPRVLPAMFVSCFAEPLQTQRSVGVANKAEGWCHLPWDQGGLHILVAVKVACNKLINGSSHN